MCDATEHLVLLQRVPTHVLVGVPRHFTQFCEYHPAYGSSVLRAAVGVRTGLAFRRLDCCVRHRVSIGGMGHVSLTKWCVRKVCG